MRRLVPALLCCAAPAYAQEAPPRVMEPATAEHYVWGGSNDGWHYLKRDDLSVIRMRMPGGAVEDKHLHRKARLFVTALTGPLTLEIADKTYVLQPGQGIEVAPGTVHRAINRTGGPIEFLVVSNPPAPGDRVAVTE